jgi:Uma2 family endonuclease
MSTPIVKAKREVHYPDSDGKPMGETGIHVNATIELFCTIKWIVFGGRPDVYVAADMFFYYEQGNPRAVKAPDIMVIKGVAHTEERRSFKLWVENRVPNVIFEFTSKKSRKDDTIVKMELYARLGVLEYYLFDPLGEFLDPRCRAYRLDRDGYVPIASETDGGFISPELGLKLRAIGTRVRLFDLATGQIIPNRAERDAGYLAGEALARDLAEERTAREKLERKAKSEAKKLEAEKQKAEAERQKAATLEAEVRRLRALLDKSGNVDPRNPGG